MDRTGIKGVEIIRLLKCKGIQLSPGHLSGILNGKTHLSARKAIALSEITGISVADLVHGAIKNRRDLPNSAGIHRKPASGLVNDHAKIA